MAHARHVKASKPSTRPTNGKSKIAQLLDIQAQMYLLAHDPKLKGSERAQSACAWERLENRLARMRGIPEPKPVDVSPEAQARRSRKLIQVGHATEVDELRRPSDPQPGVSPARNASG
jgi:hypothetical protein